MEHILQLAAQLLVVFFFVGFVGSLIVIVITFIEDIDLLFDREEPTSLHDKQ
jgi:hypothetical protein